MKPHVTGFAKRDYSIVEQPSKRRKGVDRVEQKTRMWDMSASEARTRIREGEHSGPTSGVARGYVQANLVILPSDYALDFLKFCVRNLKIGRASCRERV